MSCQFKPADYITKDAMINKLYGSGNRYDLRGRIVRQVINGHPGHTLRLAMSALDPISGERIVEFGAGNGYFAEFVRLKGVNIIATDISYHQLSRAKTRYPDICYLVADIDNPPFPARSVDAVILNFMLYHLENPAIALETTSRLLKPDGRIIITTKGSQCFSEVENWHSEALNILGLGKPPSRDELRASEVNIQDLLPEGFNIATKIYNSCIVQFSQNDVCAYLDSTPRTHYGVSKNIRSKYHEIACKAAEKDSLQSLREEWIFVIKKFDG